MRSLLALALSLVVLAPGRGVAAVDLPGLLDLALEPLVTAAVAVQQGDRTAAATAAGTVGPLVDAVIAGLEDPALATALGRKARAFGRRAAKLRAKAARAATVLGKPAASDGAAMRALKRASKAGLKALRFLAPLPLPGIVILEDNVRSAGFHQPGQVVTLRAVIRDEAGSACGESPEVTVTNLAAAMAVVPAASDLGDGRFSVTMGQAGGGARLEVAGCGQGAQPGRLLFNAGPRDDPQPRSWTLTEIMTGSSVGYLPQIALDAVGSPHVVSMSFLTDSYEYSTPSGGGWTTAMIATAAQACGSNVGERSDIAVDGAGVLHVSLEVPDKAVQHGVRGGGWSVTDVSTTICPFGGPSPDQAYAFVGHNAIAADPSAGGVWLVGWFWNGVSQRYAVAAWRTGDGATRQIEEGTAPGDTTTGRNPSVAVDSTGAAHVSYESFAAPATSLIRHARWNGAGFSTTTVASSASGRTAVVVDAGNVPHVGYYASGQGYTHAVWNGAGWTADRITPDSPASGQTWIDAAIDASNEIHVVYARGAGDVRYARGRAGSWSAPVVIAADGDHPTIAVTQGGQPHVVFRDPSGDRLLHAIR